MLDLVIRTPGKRKGLTRVSVEVSLAGTLATNWEPGRVVRANQCGWACSNHQYGDERSALQPVEMPTVRSKVYRAISNAAANIVGDADGEIVPVNE